MRVTLHKVAGTCRPVSHNVRLVLRRMYFNKIESIGVVNLAGVDRAETDDVFADDACMCSI